MDVNTRTLRYFAAVAEELSFTCAAERLFVSQSVVSRQIRQLEQDLRVRLFERTTREVRLTAAGRALLSETNGLLGRWHRVQQAVRSADSRRRGTLRLGFVPGGVETLTARLYAAASEFPDLRVEPRRLDWGTEPAALRDEAVDAAFVWLPADLTGLHTLPVAVEPRYAGLSAQHRLAGRSSLAITDLLDDPITVARSAPRTWIDWWAVNPRPGGTEPRWGPRHDHLEEQLAEVSAGAACCLVPASTARRNAWPGISWLPVTDIDPVRIVFAWSRRGPGNDLRRVADLVHTISREAADSTTSNRGGETNGHTANPGDRHQVV